MTEVPINLLCLSALWETFMFQQCKGTVRTAQLWTPKLADCCFKTSFEEIILCNPIIFLHIYVVSEAAIRQGLERLTPEEHTLPQNLKYFTIYVKQSPMTTLRCQNHPKFVETWKHRTTKHNTGAHGHKTRCPSWCCSIAGARPARLQAADVKLSGMWSSLETPNFSNTKFTRDKNCVFIPKHCRWRVACSAHRGISITSH